MRQGAVSISKKVARKKDFDPKLILDVGYQTRLSSLDLNQKFPEAKILSYQFDYSNFLIDSTALAYHDKISFKYFNINSFHIDDMVFGLVDRSSFIDLITLDVRGKEREILKYSGIWADSTRYIRIILGLDYDYKEAKEDLRKLGFESYAIYDKENFAVVGERKLNYLL